MESSLYQFRLFEGVMVAFNNVFFYHHYVTLFLLWFLLSFFVFIVMRSLNHVIYLGMAEEDKEASTTIEKNGKKIHRGIFSAMQYDKPFFSLLLIRQTGFFVRIAILFILSLFITMTAVDAVSLIFNTSYVFEVSILYKYVVSVNNNYGGLWICTALLVGWITSSLIYHHSVKLFFGELDKEYNEESIKKRPKTSLRSDQLTDIRDYKFINEALYDPTQYFDEAKKADCLFLGIDDARKPILYPKKKWDETNVQVMGKMGSGKGVLSMIALVQCVYSYDDIAIVFDPKNDEWAYHVLKNYVDKDNFIYIDLNREQPPQINLFKNATPDELNELLVASFGLGEKGTTADFYKPGDRKVSRKLKHLFPNGTNLRELIAASKTPDFRDSMGSQGVNFFNLLEELGELDAISAVDGIDLHDIINNRKKTVVYITGSLRDEVVVKAQKMLFLRIVQILEKRDRSNELTHVNIMLDELKYMLSKSALEAMGTLRDKKANIIFTHQSRGDLEIDTQEIDGKKSRQIVEDSAGLRWIYRTDVYDSAKWASDFTAGGLVDVERRSLSVNQSNVEMASKDASIFKQKANYIDISVIQNLPARCGLIVGDGQHARLAYSSPIMVSKSQKVVTYHEEKPEPYQLFIDRLDKILQEHMRNEGGRKKQPQSRKDRKPVENNFSEPDLISDEDRFNVESYYNELTSDDPYDDHHGHR